jgi:hypothetical protein
MPRVSAVQRRRLRSRDGDRRFVPALSDQTHSSGSGALRVCSRVSTSGPVAAHLLGPVVRAVEAEVSHLVGGGGLPVGLGLVGGGEPFECVDGGVLPLVFGGGSVPVASKFALRGDIAELQSIGSKTGCSATPCAPPACVASGGSGFRGSTHQVRGLPRGRWRAPYVPPTAPLPSSSDGSSSGCRP